MSNWVNPLFCGGYVDDEIGSSVQGCYVGNMDAPQEALVDRKLRKEARELAERKARLNQLSYELEYAISSIAVKKRRGVSDDKLVKLRQRALELREEIDKLKAMGV